MATGDIIDRAYISFNGKTLVADSIDVELDDGTKLVEAMTRDREPIGFSSGNMRATIKADIAMTEDDVDDVDFTRLWSKQTNVSVTVEFENGQTYTWNKGRIVKPSIQAKQGDHSKRTVEIVAYQMSYC